MASLALQIFVNLNKILGQFPGASPGANYSKQLVDRLKVDHAKMLTCSDPTNAHTHALSAFALSLGLKELRSHDIEQAEALAPALAYALAIADNELEQLGEEEVHLILMAHEYYKAHFNGKKDAPDNCSSTTWGKARSATDQIPLAITQLPKDQDTLDWQSATMKEAPPSFTQRAHVGSVATGSFDLDIFQRSPVSHVDLGLIALPEIKVASTGVSDFQTEEAIILTQTQSETVEDVRIFDEVRIPVSTSASGTTPTIAPSLRSAILHPVRHDLVAVREFTGNKGELIRETVTEWGQRQRKRVQQEGIPHAGWQAPPLGQPNEQHPLGRYLHSSPADRDNSQISAGSETYDSTFVHSQSAPDRMQSRHGQQERRQGLTLLMWTLASLCLALPPVAFFQAGALWAQGRKGHSSLLMALGAIGTAVFILIGIQKI